MRYVEKELSRIIANMPNGLNELESVLYVYLELGKIFSETNEYRFAHRNTRGKRMIDIKRKRIYNKPYEKLKNRYTVCKQMAKVFVNAVLELKKKGLHVDAKTCKNSHGHYDAIVSVGGKHFFCNLIADISRIQSHYLIRNFGHSLQRVSYREDILKQFPDVIFDSLPYDVIISAIKNIEMKTNRRYLNSDSYEKFFPYRDTLPAEIFYIIIDLKSDKEKLELIFSDKRIMDIASSLDYQEMVNFYERILRMCELKGKYTFCDCVSRYDLSKKMITCIYLETEGKKSFYIYDRKKKTYEKKKPRECSKLVDIGNHWGPPFHKVVASELHRELDDYQER